MNSNRTPSCNMIFDRRTNNYSEVCHINLETSCTDRGLVERTLAPPCPPDTYTRTRGKGPAFGGRGRTRPQALIPFVPIRK